MRESETFGAEVGSAEDVVKWMNEEAERRKAKFEARLYGNVISSENFGKFYKTFSNLLDFTR